MMTVENSANLYLARIIENINVFSKPGSKYLFYFTPEREKKKYTRNKKQKKDL